MKFQQRLKTVKEAHTKFVPYIYEKKSITPVKVDKSERNLQVHNFINHDTFSKEIKSCTRMSEVKILCLKLKIRELSFCAI